MHIFEEKFGPRRRTNMKHHVARTSTDWRRYGRETPGSAKRGVEIAEENAIIATEALDAVQSIVGALTHPEGGRFVATFDDTVGGGLTNGRDIRVTSKPLFDQRLKMADACTVLAGLAVHEIGHVHLGHQAKTVAGRYWPGSKTMLALANIVDDVRIDERTRSRFPGMAPTIRPVRQYLALNADMGDMPPLNAVDATSLSDKVNLAITALFYAPYRKWTANDATRAERRWWQAWGERAAVAHTDAEVLRVLAAALTRVTPEPEPQDEPGEGEDGDDGQPEPKDDPSVTPVDDEPEDEPPLYVRAGEEPEDAPEADDEPEQGDEPSDGEDGQGEGENEPTDSEDEGDEPDDSPETTDEDTVGLVVLGAVVAGRLAEVVAVDGDPGDDDEIDLDDEDDEPQGEEQGTSFGDDTDGGDGSDLTDVDLDNLPDAPTEDDDIKLDVPDLDQFNQATPEDHDLAVRVKKERKVEKVTMGDGFGSMRIVIE